MALQQRHAVLHANPSIARRLGLVNGKQEKG